MTDILLRLQPRSALASFLLQAETRPGMYLGSFRADDLAFTLAGWSAHRQFMKDEDPAADALREFHAFVQDHFRTGRSSKGWGTVIAENTDDPRTEFAVFMTLFRAYLEGLSDADDNRAE